LKEIGKGKFGIVYEYKDDDKVKYALKCMNMIVLK